MTQSGQKKYYIQLIQEIKSKRKTLDSILSKLEKREAIKKLEEALNKLEKEMIKPKTVTEVLQDQIEDIEILTETCEESLRKTASEYEGVYNEYKELLKQQKKDQNIDTLPSDEEIKKREMDCAKAKLDLNTQSLKIAEQFRKQKEAEKRLKKKKTIIEKNILTAEALGLTVDEYLTIESTLKNQEIMKRILQEKGLDDLVLKKKSELTKEEKQELEEAHKKIVEEISEFKASVNDASIVDAIQALYNINDLYAQRAYQTIKMGKKDISHIKNNTQTLPEKIITRKRKPPVNYVPGETPSDMKPEMLEPVQQEEKKISEPRKYVIDLHETKSSNAVLQDLFKKVEVVDNSDTGFTFKGLKVNDSFKEELQESPIEYNIVPVINGRANMQPSLKNVLASNMKTDLANVTALLIILDRLDNLSSEDKELLYREYNEKQLDTTNAANIQTLRSQVNSAVNSTRSVYNRDRMSELYRVICQKNQQTKTL